MQETFQKLFANKIGKESCKIDEIFQIFGPVGFKKEVRSLILSEKNNKNPTILLIP